MSGCEDDVLADVRELELFGVVPRHASDSSGSLFDQSASSFVDKLYPPGTTGRVVEPASRPKTDRFEKVLVVASCEVLAVVEGAYDKVCVFGRRVPGVVVR